MGNALEFQCPKCGQDGQKSVTRTEGDIIRIALPGEQTASCRLRRRHCPTCKQEFETSEVSEATLSYLVEMARLSEKLTSRLAARGISASPDDELRAMAIACLRLFSDIFGSPFPQSWEAIYPLSDTECALITYRTEEVVSGLENEEIVAIHSKYGRLYRNVEEPQMAVEEVLQKALRKLKHPSRSRRLRFSFGP